MIEFYKKIRGITPKKDDRLAILNYIERKYKATDMLLSRENPLFITSGYARRYTNSSIPVHIS